MPTPQSRPIPPPSPAASPVPPAPPVLLFTAFEPSGDDHAAAVILEIRKRHPHVSIFAWGGPKMAAAGATIVARTGDRSVIGLPGWGVIKHYRRVFKDIDAWLRANKPTLHIPVDSPGANFPVAKMAKRAGVRVVHLVAPQLWAWGPWRVNKLRKRTDLVLCILPFEEDFFRTRGVRAKFVGHPLFDEPLDIAALDAQAKKLPEGELRIALFAGSRTTELRRNFPVLLKTFRELKRRYPGVVGVFGATTEAVRQSLYDRSKQWGGWPEGLDCVAGQTDTVVRWCDLALVKSGTVTLQIAKQAKPMVIFYKASKLAYHAVGRWIISTPYIALPNLIAGYEIIPELVPYFDGPERLIEAADELISDPAAQETQRRALRGVIARFAGRHCGEEAAAAICEEAGL
ncbi:MAG: lipid-A-disaccharide synthase [Phycisphaerales bacterium]